MKDKIIYHYRCSFDNGYSAQSYFVMTNKLDLKREEHDKWIKDMLKRPGLGRTECSTPQEFIDCLKMHGYEAEMIEENHSKMPFDKDTLPYLHNISGNY